MFWFHCGRCGSLFQSEAGETDERLCPKCCLDPSPGILDVPAEPAKPAITEPDGSAKAHRTKRSIRKRKNPHLMLKIFGGWLVVIATIVLGARWMWQPDAPARPAAVTSGESAATEEDTAFLNESIRMCMAAFSGFLSFSTQEGQSQFVLSPTSTAARMDRYFSMNPSLKINPESLALVGKSVVHLPSSKAIATFWKSKEGKLYDAVFQEENGEWRLDWDQFARYSDYPWALFLAGNGPSEGEFRLLARERLAEERKDAEDISLVLYAPRIGEPGETGFQSPEFLVSKKTRDGQLLDAAFKLARSGGQVFNPQLPNLNPDGLIRVRVKVRRTETDTGQEYQITRVIACHWYSVDDPGVVPAGN